MNIRLVAIATATALALSACGGAKTSQTRPVAKAGSAEDIVAHNAQARWDALIAKDFRTAYDYLTPGTRATTPYDSYVKRLAGASIRWTSAKVASVECNEPDVCRAAVEITYLVQGAQSGMGEIEGRNPVFEQWIRSGDQWLHLPATTGR